MAKISFKEKIQQLFKNSRPHDTQFFEDLTDSLIEGDIGPKTAFEVSEQLESFCKKEHVFEQQLIIEKLLLLLDSHVFEYSLEPPKGLVSIYLLLGINGVGKTTSAGKLALWYKNKDVPVVLAAADTFRAAAIEQLQYHGERTGVRVVSHKSGGDPGAVIFDAADSLRSKGGGLVIADTAGRLHTKENLLKELQKINRIAQSKADAECYKKILVLDATTGQNGLRQAEVFHESIGVDAIILTKYDSTAKGGIVITIGKELKIPIAFIGSGEKYSDFSLFSKQTYLHDFVGVL